jgi:predicted TIM-barrel fold metal-dependent hydrolase
MSALGYPIVDADNHYYEPDDCCTRHLESKYRDRAVHLRRDANGEGQWYFGDRLLRFHPLARDKVMRPGDYRVMMSGGPKGEWQQIGSDQPEFRERDTRLAVMDAQDVEAAIIVPSFGVAFDADIEDDVEATYANVRSFNRFIEDDWGYAYEERIFAPPYVPMLDPQLAIDELERVLALGARAIVMRAGPARFGVSPADPEYDGVWARIQEADVPVIYHIGMTSYFTMLGPMWGEDPANANEEHMTPFQSFLCFGTRPVADTIANIIMRNLFGRFPRLKVVSLEHGVGWVKEVLKTDRMFRVNVSTLGGEKVGRNLTKLPSQALRENVFVAPFHEENFRDIVDQVGSTQVLYGSDWPHPEGVPQPLDMLSDLVGLTDDEVRRIAHDNTAGLLKLTAA